MIKCQSVHYGMDRDKIMELPLGTAFEMVEFLQESWEAEQEEHDKAKRK